MKDFEKLQEMDRRARELAGLYAAERERADSLEAELRSFSKIHEHYEHAKAKHPYFCDRLLFSQDTRVNSDRKNTLSHFTVLLEGFRRRIAHCFYRGIVSADDLLQCEEFEMKIEILTGNTAAAIEECYDAIVVLLRMVDVLEGHQALGDPAKKEGAKY